VRIRGRCFGPLRGGEFVERHAHDVDVQVDPIE
jgi:hypothetical protein